MGLGGVPSALRPRLPFVFTAGYADERVSALLSRSIARDCLQRPFTVAEFSDVLAGLSVEPQPHAQGNRVYFTLR